MVLPPLNSIQEDSTTGYQTFFNDYFSSYNTKEELLKNAFGENAYLSRKEMAKNKAFKTGNGTDKIKEIQK